MGSQGLGFSYIIELLKKQIHGNGLCLEIDPISKYILRLSGVRVDKGTYITVGFGELTIALFESFVLRCSNQVEDWSSYL